MEDRRTLTWYTFGITMVGLALLAVMVAMLAAMSVRWPSVIRGSMASRLTADYSAEALGAAVRQAPVEPNLILDKLADEGGRQPTIAIGPLATAVAPVTPTPTEVPPTSTPTVTPRPTDKPKPQATQRLELLPTSTPTLPPTATNTPTPEPTIPPTLTPTPTPRPTVAPTEKDESVKPVNVDPTATLPVSPP